MNFEAVLLYVAVGVLSYLIGSFPTGVVLTRRKFGIDVREMGSGNIGATNVTRVFGWYAGALVFLADLAKGALPLYYLRSRFPELPWLLTTAALALVIGHCFSIYLRFRGGKGVATSLGCILVAAPWAAAIGGAAYILLLAVTRISAVGSLGGILTSIVYVFVASPSAPVDWILMGTSLIVLVRHRSNIERLISSR